MKNESTGSALCDAIDAKELMLKAHESGINRALQEVGMRANAGFDSVVLFNVGLGFNQIQQLMKLGFSVSEIVDPLSNRFIKLTW